MPTRSVGARDAKSRVAAFRTHAVSSISMSVSSNTTATKRCGNAAMAAAAISAALGVRFWRFCGGLYFVRFWRLGAERGNYLRLAVIGKLEIFLFKIGHDFAAAVADHDAHQNQIDAHLKCGRSVAGGNF